MRMLIHGWTTLETFTNINQARISVFQFIETFYNSKRIQQTFGCRRPDEFEELHRTNLAVGNHFPGVHSYWAITSL